MIFLQGPYEWVAASLESSVNHFPLIQLVFNSVDKTILYYLIWLILRAAYLLDRHRKTSKKIPLYKEGLLHALFIYIVLLLQLTVFRNEETFWTVEYHQIDWSAIHWLPLVDTVKLFYGDSGFSAWYNSWGNVVWFIPLGYMGPYLFRKKCSFLKVTAIGFLFSGMIEFLQLIFQTGVTHIDDVLFNTLGTAIGYGIWASSKTHSSAERIIDYKGSKQ